jgi:Protein of unknown function (DUF998)
VLGSGNSRTGRYAGGAGRGGPRAGEPGPAARQATGSAALWVKIGALAGIAGPAAFTLAWVLGSVRQRGLPASAPQISGLAAENARDPWIMIAGFLLLGGCAIGFGPALAAGLGGRRRAGPAPAVIAAAGVVTIATGLLRRDHVLLTAGAQSWHNRAHDVTSAVAYVLLVLAPVLLAVRFRRDPRWRALAAPVAAAAVVSAGVLIAFYSAPHNPWDGTLQRIAVTLPLAAIAAVAGRLLAHGSVPAPGSAGLRPAGT